MEGMPDELQLLPPDKTRDPDNHILLTHLESLLLLTTTKVGREHMREAKVYPIIREVHLHLADDDEDVAAVCDRIVQVSTCALVQWREHRKCPNSLLKVLMVEQDLAEDPPLGMVEEGENDVVEIL
jgi:hypothetical protein